MIGGGSSFEPGGVGPSDLAKCLESLRPTEFDQIVIADTSLGDEGRAVVAKESQYRESVGLPAIEMPAFAWIEDFAAARNFSLSFIKTDWLFWCDSDDVIEGPENIRVLAEQAHEQEGVGFYWLPYRYAFDEYGTCTTLHDRERLLRTAQQWKWRRRVHEVLDPKKPTNWLKSDAVILNHLRGHVSHTGRNIKLLLMMLEDDKDDIRVWKDLGSQYFANGEWPKATEWFDRFYRDLRGGRMDRYQSLTYAARAYREMQMWKEAMRRDNQALLLIPEWMDAWLGLGQTYAYLSDWEKAEFWALASRQRDVGSRYVFINPLECQIKASEILSVAYAGQEKFTEAIAECDNYLELRPQEKRILEQRETWAKFKAQQEQRQAFLGAVPLLTDEETVTLANRLDGAGNHGAVKDILMPAVMRHARAGSQPEITFFCGASLDQWTPGTDREKGIGGSETACMEVAKRFAGAGWNTWVFNKCGEAEGMNDGVGYMNWQRWRPDDKSDLLVSWRQPGVGLEELGAREKWLWVHNLYQGGFNEETCAAFDRVMAVSEWHRDALQEVYPFLTDAQKGYLPNGIDLTRFDKDVERNPYKVVWMSSPDRGLKHLLQMWPEIYRRNILAELHIFYGWDNIDEVIWRGDKRLAKVKQDVMKYGLQAGVQWRGRVGQTQLAEELLSAQMWAYPSIWQEEFCIAGLEAMAAGLFIVTSDLGALPDTLGDVGYKMPITPKSGPSQKKWRDKFLGVMFAGLYSEEFQGQFRESGPARAQLFSWDNVFKEHWLPKVESLVKV